MTEYELAGDDLGELPSRLPDDAPFTEADFVLLLRLLGADDD